MDALDDPFAAVKRELGACPLGEACDASLVDFHAEATSEKWAFGHFVDGKASLIVGTHTHAPSADHRILAGGTGFITDVGMTGDYDSVIGMEKDEPLRRFTTPHSLRPVRAGAGARDAVRGRRGDRPRRPGESDRAGQDRRRSQPRRARFLDLMATPAPTIVYDLDGTLADTAEDLVGDPQLASGEGRARAAAGSRARVRCSGPARGR